MEKLSSLTPEGAPAERGKKGFNPYLESEKDTSTLLSFLDHQKVLRWELCSQDAFEDVREEEKRRKSSGFFSSHLLKSFLTVNLKFYKVCMVTFLYL